MQRIIAASSLVGEGKRCRSGPVENVTLIRREGASQRAQSQILAEAMHGSKFLLRCILMKDTF